MGGRLCVHYCILFEVRRAPSSASDAVTDFWQFFGDFWLVLIYYLNTHDHFWWPCSSFGLVRWPSRRSLVRCSACLTHGSRARSSKGDHSEVLGIKLDFAGKYIVASTGRSGFTKVTPEGCFQPE